MSCSAAGTGREALLGIRRIHHVAFAHEGRAALDALEKVLGLSCSAPETGPGFVERMFPVGGCAVQTLEVTGPGAVERFVERRGPALHHLAFEVDDIDAALARLKQEGTRLVDDEPRRGGEGARVAFLHPSACGGLLVELVEPEREKR
jgi:methylmalonyl-CoA/ethylmalonyl-CoA epimerase